MPLTFDKELEVNYSAPSELQADAVITSPPSSEPPYTAHSKIVDPHTQFVYPGVSDHSITHSSTPGYYAMDGQAAAVLGYQMSMMPLAYHGYHMAPAYPTAYPEINLAPPGLNGNAPVYSNGDILSRSASNSSLGNEGRAGQSSAPRATRSSMSSAANGIEQVVQLDAANISHYVSSKFCSHEFADFMLSITSDGGPPVHPIPVHGLILARSPALKSMMFSLDRQHAQIMNGLPVLQIHIDDKFVSPYQLHLGLGHLYGHPLPNFDALSYSQSNAANMTSGLVFAAVGRFLQMPHLMSLGIKSAIKYLAWDNIEEAMSFIYEGNRLVSSSTIHEREGWASITDLDNELLREIVQFLAYYFPSDFNIHTSAAELAESPRLPTIIEARPSISHARLTSIQFGEVSAEDSAKLDTSVLVSSVLLSVPTQILQTIFDSQLLGGKLGWPKVAQILRDTVAERERRRIKVRKMPAKRVVRSATLQQWEETRWEERIETSNQHPSGLAVQRTRLADEPTA